jgi:hypothetical protein
VATPLHPSVAMNATIAVVLGVFGLCAVGCGGSTDDASAPADNGAEAISTSSPSSLAGLYTDFSGDGTIHELSLNSDHTFTMDVQGLIGCTLPGHNCPSSFTEGPTGVTDLTGTWTEGTDVVHLTPKDDKGSSPPFDLSMKAQGSTKMDASAQLGTNALKGTLDVHSRNGVAHSVKEADLNGTWKVTADGPDDNPQSIWGLSTGKGDHTVIFDGHAKTVTEDPPTSSHAHDQNAGTYAISGDPSGGTLGVIVLNGGIEKDFVALRIKSLTSTKLVARDYFDQFDFTLVKQ